MIKYKYVYILLYVKEIPNLLLPRVDLISVRLLRSKQQLQLLCRWNDSPIMVSFTTVQ